MNSLCLSCLKGFNGRNGNGYMPCSCAANALNAMSEEQKKELLSQVRFDTMKRCEALMIKPTKPDFVEPPPLIKIGDSDSKEKLYLFLLVGYSSLFFVVGMVVGLLIK